MSELRWQIDAPGSWELDASHFPTPVTPYFAEILKAEFPRGFCEGSERLGLLLSHFDHEVVNGFDYLAPRIVGAPKAAKGPPPRAIFKLLTWLHPKIRRRLATAARVFETRPWAQDLVLWRDEIRPASTATHLALQARDPASLDDAGLIQLLDDLHANAHHQYYLHHRFTVTVVAPVGDFIAQARELTGLAPSELIQAVRQPRGVATDASEHAGLAAAAIRADAEAARLLDGDRSIDALCARVPAVRAWIDHVGLRLVTGYDISDLYALELPAVLVRGLRAQVAGRQDLAAADAARFEHAAKVRDQVPAARRDDYDHLLAEALSVSNLREERALICDFWAFGLARRAIKEAGRRLHAVGKLAAPLHAIEASHAELLALLRGAGVSAAELDARATYRATTSCEVAPPRLGIPPSAPPPAAWYPPATRRLNAAVEAAVEGLFHEPVPRHEPHLVRGLNASAGIYEGTARLVLHPGELDRVQQGDVLIARMTTEAYNGIIPLLGAIVTDRGGLLSHAATVAREYGIPAVVGTLEGTRRVPDGARVRVDGSRGEARVLG